MKKKNIFKSIRTWYIFNINFPIILWYLKQKELYFKEVKKEFNNSQLVFWLNFIGVMLFLFGIMGLCLLLMLLLV